MTREGNGDKTGTALMVVYILGTESKPCMFPVMVRLMDNKCVRHAGRELKQVMEQWKRKKISLSQDQAGI